jgi:hypothetical protein
VLSWPGAELEAELDADACCAFAGKRTRPKKPQRTAAASTHHRIEPDCTAFVFREDTYCQTLYAQIMPLNLAAEI